MVSAAVGSPASPSRDWRRCPIVAANSGSRWRSAPRRFRRKKPDRYCSWLTWLIIPVFLAPNSLPSFHCAKHGAGILSDPCVALSRPFAYLSQFCGLTLYLFGADVWVRISVQTLCSSLFHSAYFGKCLADRP